MKKTLFLAFASAILWVACQKENIDQTTTDTTNSESNLAERRQPGRFLVANRGSGTISIFDDKSKSLFKEIKLPDSTAQPTYLARSARFNTLYTGDFANKKVVYYDDVTFEMKGEIEIEEGAFHMWANDIAGQLWINNIVSKSTSVIDLRTNQVIKTLPLPTNEIPELTDAAVQHDVVLSRSGRRAFVTILDGPDVSYVVKYDTRTLAYEDHVTVGGDAHLFPFLSRVYVPAQNANMLSVFNGFTLDLGAEIDFPSTHGIIASKRYIFTTGISDNKIGVIDPFRGNQVIETIDTEFNVPHNLAVNGRGNTLFLAHSGGTATKVSFFDVRRDGKLTKISDFDSGLNPFGVLYY